MNTSAILTDAKSILDDTIQLRRRIHRHPELGLSGQRTTSIVARLTGARPGPTILLRADMDALPMPEETGLPFASEVSGRMHACGHDAHTAMLVGAARLLARRRDSLAGSVLFMLQPGEEGYHGARVMIEEGLLDGSSGRCDGIGRHPADRRAWQGRPRLGAPRLSRPDPDRMRDRAGIPDAGDAAGPRLRSGGCHRREDRSRDDPQRDPRQRELARHDPHG